MNDIFISYSRYDSEVVNEFVTEFEKEGFSVWIDRDGIESGDDFKRVILKAIKESTVVLFFSSEHSNVSDWTAKEIGVAVKYKKHIIPILLDDSNFNETIEFDLINLDFVDYSKASRRGAVKEKLLGSLKNKLGQVSTQTTTDASERKTVNLIKTQETPKKAVKDQEEKLEEIMDPQERIREMELAKESYYQKDYKTAIEIWRKWAEKNDAEAMCWIGEYYKDIDISESQKWIQKAAALGFTPSMLKKRKPKTEKKTSNTVKKKPKEEITAQDNKELVLPKVQIVEVYGDRSTAVWVDYKIQVPERKIYKIAINLKPVSNGVAIQNEKYILNKDGIVVFSFLDELEDIAQGKAAIDFSCDTYKVDSSGVLCWQELISSKEMGLTASGNYSYKVNLSVYDTMNNQLSSCDCDLAIQYKHKLFGPDEIKVI